ncbi:MAG: hypothetical protein AAGG80_03715, partial [Pseudomonadota bacterium]
TNIKIIATQLNQLDKHVLKTLTKSDTTNKTKLLPKSTKKVKKNTNLIPRSSEPSESKKSYIPPKKSKKEEDCLRALKDTITSLFPENFNQIELVSKNNDHNILVRTLHDQAKLFLLWRFFNLAQQLTHRFTLQDNQNIKPSDMQHITSYLSQTSLQQQSHTLINDIYNNLKTTLEDTRNQLLEAKNPQSMSVSGKNSAFFAQNCSIGDVLTSQSSIRINLAAIVSLVPQDIVEKKHIFTKNALELLQLCFMQLNSLLANLAFFEIDINTAKKYLAMDIVKNAIYSFVFQINNVLKIPFIRFKTDLWYKTELPIFFGFYQNLAPLCNNFTNLALSPQQPTFAPISINTLYQQCLKIPDILSEINTHYSTMNHRPTRRYFRN